MATEPGRLDRRASEGLPRLSVKCLKWKCAVTTLIFNARLANRLESSLRAGTAVDPAAIQTLIFNARLDAVVCGVFLVLVMAILVDSMRVWIGILRGTHEAHVCEAPFVLSQLRAEEL